MGDGVERRDLLDAASRILADEGLAALSLRRIAREAGASTMVIYTHFGDKDGLLRGLLTEGFRRFAAALRAVDERDPWDHVRELGRAYRRYAKANPSHFKLLFSHYWPEARNDARYEEARRHGEAAFGTLLAAVTRVMAALDRPARDVEPGAFQVWSTVHGYVSLELGGQMPPEVVDDLYEHALDFVAKGLGRRG
ncbi:MAG: TetR/AcrR family transcriptional regulator [Myxococcota bacterium]